MKDRKSQRILQAALGGVVAAGLLTVASSAEAKPTWEGHEKCFGVSKKGMNDCHNADHLCAGRAKTDGAEDEWVYLPKGTCEKIAGARTKPQE